MDYDRCLPAQRYYDTWYPYPAASALPAFPVRDQQDYPSPAPSCSDPSPASRAQPVIDSYTPPASDFTLTPFSQLDSSIGPLRSTRRHTSLRQTAHSRRLSLSSAILREQDPSVRDFVHYLFISHPVNSYSVLDPSSKTTCSRESSPQSLATVTGLLPLYRRFHLRSINQQRQSRCLLSPRMTKVDALGRDPTATLIIDTEHTLRLSVPSRHKAPPHRLMPLMRPHVLN